jgi:hypothetical protein
MPFRGAMTNVNTAANTMVLYGAAVLVSIGILIGVSIARMVGR